MAPRSGITKAELAYLDLQKTARQAERDGEHARADEIREALDAIDKRAVEALQALTTKHGIPEVPSTQAVQQPPAAAEPTATVTAIPPPPPPPPPAHTPIRFDWATAYGPLRDLARQFSSTGQDRAYADFRLAADQISKFVRHRFGKVGGDTKHLPPRSRGGTTTEQEYRAIQDMLRGAEESDNATRADAIRQVLEEINQHTARVWDKLARKYGAHDFLVRQATQTMQASRAMQDMYATQVMRTMQRPPPTAGSSVTVASTTVAVTGRLNIPGPPHPTVLTVNPAFPLPAGGLVNVTDVPGPPPASSLPGPSLSGPSFPGPSFPGPSLSEAAGAQARVLWRGWFDPPATVPGATAAHPAATETIVTPSLGETSPFWPQPVNPVPAPGIFPFDIGPVLSRGAPFPTPSRVDDNFAGELPQGFDASRLIAEGGMFPEFGLDEELAAGRLPLQTSDILIDGYPITGARGRSAQYIEHLRAMKESIERAPRDAYPGRVDPEWLDKVREPGLPRRRGEPALPHAASSTVPAEFAVTGIDPLLGTGEGASHPAPLPPPSAPGRTGAGAGAPPPAADPWRIRPPGMGGEPHPVAFDPDVSGPRPQQPGRAYRDDAHSGAVGRRTARAAGRRDARLLPSGLGHRRAPVLAPRGNCHAVRYRGRAAPRRAHGSARRRRRTRLVRRAVARRAQRHQRAQRHRPVGLRRRPPPGATSTGSAIDALMRILDDPSRAP